MNIEKERTHMEILFVEDDDAITTGLVYSLEMEGYTVMHCSCAKAAFQQLDEQIFDLLLLDIGLPDGNGYELCRYAKSKQDVPVIFLTAMDEEVNVVMGLDMGGDDYITKPFRVQELLSRIKSVLRRYQVNVGNERMQIRHIEINTRSGKVYRHHKEVLLTAMEYRLLLVFVNHPNQILTRSQILEGLWDVAGNFVNDNTLSVYIRRLREKLEDDIQNPNIIVTVRGLGYRLEGYHVE